MYQAIIINVLRQFGEFHCTILCTDLMGTMPEYREDRWFPEGDISSEFLQEQCTQACTRAYEYYETL